MPAKRIRVTGQRQVEVDEELLLQALVLMAEELGRKRCADAAVDPDAASSGSGQESSA